MKRTKYFFLLLLSLSFSYQGCKQSAETEEPIEVSEELIVVTNEQFESDGMILGEIFETKFSEDISCNGNIVAPAGEIAQVGIPLSGVIEKINVGLNQKVSAGQTLCTIKSMELIDLQQQFAETSAMLVRLKSDFERAKALKADSIGSNKEFVAVESEFLTMKVRVQSLKMQLEVLGVNPNEVEKGSWKNSYEIKSPVAGFVTDIEMVVGETVGQDSRIATVVGTDNLYLKLSVFETDITKLKKGQQVGFTLISDQQKNFNATLTSIGKNIDKDSKTVACTADIVTEQSSEFTHGAFVNAKIITGEYSAKSLPVDALVKDGSNYMVYVLAEKTGEGYSFRKQNVKVNRISGQLAEVSELEPGVKVLTKGGYSLEVE